MQVLSALFTLLTQLDKSLVTHACEINKILSRYLQQFCKSKCIKKITKLISLFVRILFLFCFVFLKLVC